MLRPRSTSPRRRLAGLLALIAFAFGVLGSELHTVLEPHRYCALHETVEHGDEAPHAADAVGSGALLVGLERPDTHERCRLTTLIDEDLVLVTGDPGVAVDAPVSVGPAPPPCTRRAPKLARHRLAPKQSPPAA